nr:H-2 class II histocompatibility antigen, A-R alpha chain-like [Pogona vitticeps]
MMMGVPTAGMGAPRLGLWALLLALPLAQAVEVDDIYVQADFFQESFPSGKESGEYQHEMNGEEIFHVDSEQKKDVWRLPDFRTFTGFDAQGALNDLAVLKNNLEIMIKCSNRTQAQNVAPSARVYPKDPVELGDPNVLICFVDKFSPPVLNITWLKNEEVVSKDIQETDFYSSVDNTFRKFSYLAFVPEEGDFYACKVDHWGLQESLTREWYPRQPTPPPKTTDTVVCGLGLAFAVLGIVAGPALFFKARKMKEANHRRGGL